MYLRLFLVEVAVVIIFSEAREEFLKEI